MFYIAASVNPQRFVSCSIYCIIIIFLSCCSLKKEHVNKEHHTTIDVHTICHLDDDKSVSSP